jgi:hypothetical protein
MFAELRELFRIGRRSLAIGVVVSIACLVGSQIVAAIIPNQVVARVLEGKFNYCRLGGKLASDRDLSVRLVTDPAPDRAPPAACRSAVASQIQLARRRRHRRIREARVWTKRWPGL